MTGMMETGLVGEDRLAGARSSLDDVGASLDKSTAQYMVEPDNSGGQTFQNIRQPSPHHPGVRHPEYVEMMEAVKQKWGYGTTLGLSARVVISIRARL